MFAPRSLGLVGGGTAMVVGILAGKVWAVEPDEQLIAAQIMVESRGNDKAVGDKHLPSDQWAYGCLQIRQICVDDVNEHFRTFCRASDCIGRGGRTLSILIYKKYLRIYATPARLGHQPTREDLARIWNGGPNGWKKPSTRAYWRKVEMALKYLEQRRLAARERS